MRIMSENVTGLELNTTLRDNYGLAELGDTLKPSFRRGEKGH